MLERGIIKHLCISKEKGTQKRPIDRAEFIMNSGIKDDAHAGSGHRQVSLLSDNDINTIRSNGIPDLLPGAFAENVILDGIDLSQAGLGSEIQLGDDVILAISQIGKECHSHCQIFHRTGDCIMPRLGLFARVKKGGKVTEGDAVQINSQIPRSMFQSVVITVSDRCSRKEAVDTAGPAVSDLLKTRINTHIYETIIIPDEKDRIKESLCDYSGGHSIDLVITVGGTGFSPRDVTPEATREVIERFTPGLDETMRYASLRKTSHAMLSPGVSGIRRSTLIVNLPGSERAARENLEVIIPALEHGLLKLKGDPSDCA